MNREEEKQFKGGAALKTDLKESRFCEEYLIDLNGTQAAIRAGFPQRSAAVEASKLLKKPNIQRQIAGLQSARAMRSQINADRVLQEIGRLAFANLTDVVTLSNEGLTIRDDLTDDAKASIESVTITETVRGDTVTIKKAVKMHSKVKALELLVQHLGLTNQDEPTDEQPILTINYTEAGTDPS